MRITYKNSNREEVTIEVASITVHLNSVVDYELRETKFNELHVSKHQYGPDTASIIMSPAVANVITLK